MPREATLRAKSYTPASVPESDKLKCLWIGRNIPYPLDEGAKVYSAKLAESLAAAGASIRFLGFGAGLLQPNMARRSGWAFVGTQLFISGRRSHFAPENGISGWPKFQTFQFQKRTQHWLTLLPIRISKRFQTTRFWRIWIFEYFQFWNFVSRFSYYQQRRNQKSFHRPWCFGIFIWRHARVGAYWI